MGDALPAGALVGGLVVLGVGALALAVALADDGDAPGGGLPRPRDLPNPSAAADRLLSTLRSSSMQIPPGMPPRPGVYFDWSEFIVTSRRVDNTLPTWAYPRILALVQRVLDPVRQRIGRPVGVTSGYRSPALNQLIGGAAKSQHTRAEAADIKAGDMPAEALATEIVRSGVPFDQVIWYDRELGGHVHVSHRFDGPPRPFSDLSKMMHAYVVNRAPDGTAQRPYQKGYRPWAPPSEQA